MASPDFAILDVGHGSCALLTAGRDTALVDAAPGAVLLDTLADAGITEIQLVLVSHADADHIGGLASLLASKSVRVKEVYVNSDSIKKSEVFRTFRIALRDARKRTKTRVTPALTTDTPAFVFGEVKLEILAPEPEVAVGGPGSTDLSDRPVTGNNMSAVVRVIRNDSPWALLAGDLDGVGLDNLLAAGKDISAKILVFPHHGGLPGASEPIHFAERLVKSVKPEVVVFSIGRGVHGTPRPEIIRAVRRVAPNAHIACTQLSLNCAANLSAGAVMASSLPGAGKEHAVGCAGTIVSTLEKRLRLVDPTQADHQKFVARHAPQGLCVVPVTSIRENKSAKPNSRSSR